jgi:gliding motility-associated-like protein
MKLFFFIFFLSLCSSLFGQAASDACITATPMCPNESYSGSNYNATSTVCTGCEDDFTICFSGDNTVWYQFTTNASGGNVSFTFNNIVFNPQAGRGNLLQAAILSAVVPCDAATYTLVSNCEAAGVSGFSLNALALPPNSTYYLVINGATNGGATLPAEATFDVSGSGTGFDRPTPAITITGPSDTICPNAPTSFNAYLVNCTDTSDFHWYINGIERAVTQEAYWTTSVLQHGDVVSVACSCFSLCPDTISVSFPAIAVDSLTVFAGNDVTIQKGESIVLVGQSNGFSFSWSPSQNINTPDSITTYANPDETTTYTLTAFDSICALSDNITVFVMNNLTIPGSFSPNGDGSNDKWIIEGIEFYPDTQVIIYDRWGQKIADISGYSLTKAWDGTNKGKPVSDGVYFYSLDLHQLNGSKPIKGSISLIR